ncbi:hypothetical protein LTR78_010275 [Recurvomyces mirabilis]|uniref:Uncharacterized protein n=1 Tax=Recurvomyces mirabilis TaxID=574656 RepID=A0AAE0WGY4_9PEZI|nr:hypothetical protein LTR78_010275 [Recurvomyces mirabilis]KAK5149655.1 hypothetical protein LTS14_010786 [Recurvomyces mirabilis]
MAHVIQAAESRGFVVGEHAPAGSELSPDKLAEILQKFAPEDLVAGSMSSPAVDKPLSSKKRRFRKDLLPDQHAENVWMDGNPPIETNNAVSLDDPFQRFLTTIQQHSDSSASVATGADPIGDIITTQPHTLPTADPQYIPFAAPPESPASQFKQLAPFLEMVDWDASLEHFLDNQYSESSNLDWCFGNTDLDSMGSTL